MNRVKEGYSGIKIAQSALHHRTDTEGHTPLTSYLIASSPQWSEFPEREGADYGDRSEAANLGGDDRDGHGADSVFHFGPPGFRPPRLLQPAAIEF
jgi:hypothetical protein